MTDKKRQSNLDLLRIVAFMMVVIIHISTTGVKQLPIHEVNWFFATLLESLTRPAVHLFILLGGFFLGTRAITPPQALNRTKDLIPPMILFALIHYVAFVRPMGITSLWGFLSTFLTGSLQYNGTEWYGHLWFMYPYAFLMLLSPLINSAIITLEKKQLQQLIATLFVCFLVLPSLNLSIGQKVIYQVPGPLPYFITSYITGGYLKRFGLELSRNKLLFLYGGTTLWTWGGTIIQAHLFPPIRHQLPLGELGSFDNFFVNEQWAVFVGAVALFELFRGMTIAERPMLVKMGQAGFLAYTIHMMIMFRFYDMLGYAEVLRSAWYLPITLGIIGSVTLLSLFYGMGVQKFILNKLKK